jgi:hypothetical protein
MGRGKVNADSSEVIKVIRAELHNGARLEDFALADNEKFMDTYAGFMAALLSVCPYPSQGLIEDACKQAWDDKSDQSVTFASRIIKAITFCRQKVKSMKSGIKLGPGCTRICNAIKKSIISFKRSKSGESSSPPSKKKKKGGLSPSNEKVAKPGSKDASSSSATDTASILALYGVKSSTAPLLPTLDSFEATQSTSCCEISSDEAIKPAAAAKTVTGPTNNGTGTQKPSAVQPFGEPWLCNKDMTLKRMGSDGQIQLASMSAGTSGFAVARFPNTTVEIQTELPNLCLELQQQAFKKPASAKKALKKPKTKAKAKVAKDTDSDDSSDLVAPQPKKAIPAKPEMVKEVSAAGPSTKVAPAAVSNKKKIETGATSSTALAPQAVQDAKPQNRSFQSEVYGQSKAEYYTAKSYIRHLVDGKWKLIIGSSHPRHWAIISALTPYVESGKSKDELLAEREILEAEDAQ